jgi:diguanylate cyclase (GGDEF)-like protein
MDAHERGRTPPPMGGCYIDFRLSMRNVAKFTMIPKLLKELRSRSLATAGVFLRWYAGRQQSLVGHFNFGIAARLIAAFIGVGILVLVANLVVVKGVLIERTTQITRVAPPPAPPTVEPKVEAAPQPVVTPPPAPRRVVTSDALTMAIDRFGRALKDRVATNSDETQAEYQTSAAQMEEASRTFVAQASAISGKGFVKITSGIKAYSSDADQLVRLADDRHSKVRQYATLFEQLYARVNTSVKGAWKVFGRVVARQSLLQLSNDLDELRRDSIALQSADSSDAAGSLIKTEEAVVSNLKVNEKSFRRSEGDPWYSAMSEDLTNLLALRESIIELNAQLRAQSPNAAASASNIGAVIPAKVESLIAVSASNAKAKPGSERTAAAHITAVPTPPSPAIAVSESAPPPIIETHSITTDTPENQKKRTLVAWISTAVLALLSLIAFGTVLSVVRPVRRLHDATLRLAKGDTAVQVQRGGIRELDTLAIAFNTMASELAVAKAATRDYQADLEAKVAERTLQLQDLAERDPLTGLPNRRELFVLLNAAIARARTEGCLVGIFFLDIDNFKYLNDGMGHAFGDRVLVSLATRLQEASRELGFAARLGGDEFTVVIGQAANLEDIRRAGLGIVQAFQKPLSVDGRDLIVSVSVGASVFPDHEQEADALLRAADAALFRAKALGRSQLSVFTPELLEAAAAKFTTEQGLRRAIERGEFELLFQPELHVETMETALVEALIRWRMPDGTLASPGQFLAIAEESGLIMEISDWVLRSAIETAAHWHHGEWPEVRVAINVSPRQLLDNRFSDRVFKLLGEYNLPTRCIEIELTESVLQTGTATIEALHALRAQGLAIALDDFGTGYSSLASVEQLPLTRIKLDRSLIDRVDTSTRSAAIARAIITMCQGLGLEITAEGVERPEQFAMLSNYAGMYLQGYLLSPPVSRDQVINARLEVQRRAQELLLTSATLVPSNAPDAHSVRIRQLTEAG